MPCTGLSSNQLTLTENPSLKRHLLFQNKSIHFEMRDGLFRNRNRHFETDFFRPVNGNCALILCINIDAEDWIWHAPKLLTARWHLMLRMITRTLLAAFHLEVLSSQIEISVQLFYKLKPLGLMPKYLSPWSARSDFSRSSCSVASRARGRISGRRLAEMNIKDYRASYGDGPRPPGNAGAKTKKKKVCGGREVAARDYRDADGKLVYQTVRFADPKDFMQRKPKGNGGWIYKNVFKGRGLCLLGCCIAWARAAEINILEAPVLSGCEGEKLTDNVRALDLNPIATCVAGQCWTAELADALKGRDIWILQDNDDAGPRGGIGGGGPAVRQGKVDPYRGAARPAGKGRRVGTGLMPIQVAAPPSWWLSA